MIEKGFSIIIPTYNRERTIEQCIKSVLEQNYEGNIEVIISDDGSTDRTLQIAKNMNDDRIVILTKKNSNIDQGAAFARNRGLKEARYEYIAFLDSDDYYLPNYFKIVSDILDNNSDIGYTFCRSKKEVSSNGKLYIEDWTRIQLSKLDKKYHVLYRSLNINTNVIVVRKKIIDQVGFFNTNLINGQDSDMWIRISEISQGKFLDIYGATYRVNHSNHQLTQNDKKIKRSCAIIIYTNALQRFIDSRHNDKLRLLLIIRMILYMRMSERKGFIFSIYRFSKSSILLFLLFPRTFIVYLLYGSTR